MADDEAEKQTTDEWIAEYGVRRTTYAEFATRLEALVKDLLKAEPIEVIQVESRAKEVSSFAEKIRRKDRSDQNPFVSVTDLIGIRIITYYLDDVITVGELLEREFSIDPEKSSDKFDDLASDQFGYRSAHYVATLTPARSSLVEWQGFSGIPVEFQVRTSLQHAWAAVSHKIDYKGVREAPASTRRKLFQLSALFELADEQFASLRDQRVATFTAYKEEVSEGRLGEVPIDTSSVAAYWTLSKTAETAAARLASAGFLTIDASALDEDRLVRDRNDLVRALNECGLPTLAHLDRLLLEDRTYEVATAVANNDQDDVARQAGSIVQSSFFDVLTMILLVQHDRIDDLGPEIYVEAFLPRLRAAAMELKG